MTYIAKCDNCDERARKPHGFACPIGWLYLESERQSDKSVYIVWACSEACRDNLWKKGPGPSQEIDEDASHAAIAGPLAASTRDIAAYLLDRADQYDTESPCWIALSDAAHNLMLGEVDASVKAGELDDLYKRVDGFRRKRPRKVSPDLGVKS